MNKTDLIYKVLRNAANPQELRVFRHWVDESAENLEEFCDTALLWGMSETPLKLRGRRKSIHPGHAFRLIPLKILYFALLATGIAYAWSFPFLQQRSKPSFQLSYHQENLAAILKDLGLHFQVRIDLHETTNSKCEFTGTFSSGNSLSDILNELQKALPLEIVKYKNDSYRIIPHCATNRLTTTKGLQHGD